MLPSANPINTPLVQDVTLSTTTINENEAAGTAVGTLGLAISSDGPVQFKLVHGEGSEGNSRFKIVGDQLVAKSSLNYEQQSSYSVRVQGKDSTGAVSVHVFTVQVQDINEAPTAINFTASPLAENSAIGTVAGTLSAVDQDNGDTFTYTLVSGEGSTDNAAFSISGNSVQTAASLDFETQSTYSIRVRATDANGLSFERVIAIKITNVNEPLPVTLSNDTIAENQPAGTVVGTLGLTGAPDGPLQYKLVSGAGSEGNAKFKIVGNQLVAKSSLNFEDQSSYSIRVQVKDSAGNISTEVFTITVTDANDAVTGIAFDAANLPEDAAIGAVAGTLTAVDQDNSDTWTYTLVAGQGATDNESFTIVGDTIKTASTLDYETKSTYMVRVRATDGGGLFYERAITIHVTNVNEAPTAILLSKSTVASQHKAGTVVGKLTGVDPDAKSQLQFSLVDGAVDNAQFRIDGSTLKTNAVFDVEVQSSYTVRVRVTDGGGLTYDQDFTVTVA